MPVRFWRFTGAESRSSNIDFRADRGEEKAPDAACGQSLRLLQAGGRDPFDAVFTEDRQFDRHGYLAAVVLRALATRISSS